MTRTVMVVYNTLNTDARVHRAASAISKITNLTVLGCGMKYGDPSYEEVILNGEFRGGQINYALFIRDVIRHLKNERFDILYAHDYYTAPIAIWIKLFYPHRRVIYDAHELFIPQKGEPLGGRQRFFYLFERIVARRADCVICANERRAVVMQIHFQLKEQPVAIRNISYLDADPAGEKSLDPELERFLESDDMKIVYEGSVREERHVDELIKVVGTLEANIRLLILGLGENSGIAEEIAAGSFNGRVLIRKTLPHRLLGNVLGRCDVGYMYYDNEILNNRLCEPNKLYEYVGAGLAVVTNSNVSLSKTIEEYGIGIASDDIGAAIRGVFCNLEEYKKNCKPFCKRNPWIDEEERLKEAFIKTCSETH